MNTELISGRFSAEEAKTLLTALTRIKTDFHHNKIRTVLHDEEDIKHSERRIKTLEDNLRRALQTISNENTLFVDLLASVEVKPVTA